MREGQLEPAYSWDTGLLRQINEDSILCTSFDLRTRLGLVSAGLFAVEVAQRFEFNLGAGKAETLTLRLQVLSEHEQGLLRGGLKRIGGWPPAAQEAGGS